MEAEKNAPKVASEALSAKARDPVMQAMHWCFAPLHFYFSF